MSKVTVELNKGEVIIKKDLKTITNQEIELVKLEEIIYDKEYKSNVCVSSEKQNNQILFLKKFSKKEVQEIFNKNKEFEKARVAYIEKCINTKIHINDAYNNVYSTSAFIVYSKDNKIYYCFGELAEIYKRLIKVPYKVFWVGLNKNNLKLNAYAYIINKYNIPIEKTTFYINKLKQEDIKISERNNKMSKLKLLLSNSKFKVNIKLKTFLEDDSKIEINNPMSIALYVDGQPIQYRITYKFKEISKSNYAPIKSTYLKDYAFHIRRTMKGSLVFVKRLKEPEEKEFKFRILESKFVSSILYIIGKCLTNVRRKKINVFYEKYAKKAEEGVYELYKKCCESKNTKNYFIIDEKSSDYERIKEDKGVIKKYSFKYYWIIYNCKNFIASEAPGHLNILRSNNKYFRKALNNKEFIFLQHGIIYMKNLEKNSAFAKGKEAESKYMVVSSEKEREVVTEMLGYSEEQLMKTGLAMYCQIKYNHINNNSEDYVTVMLTWKPYEEHLYNCEDSSYYKNVIEICDILKKYIPEDKIIIIVHPKAQSVVENTGLKDIIWKNPISEALEKTKLLITDYSSVCYNAFYQGAGVIFYQPDLDFYERENGKLIPNNDEYIGKRLFTIEELDQYAKEIISEGKINIEDLRKPEYEENYKTINEFSDGKNIERIFEELKNKKII